MNTYDAMDSVDLVDTLMTKKSMGISPTAEELNKAKDLGIDTDALGQIGEMLYECADEPEEQEA